MSRSPQRRRRRGGSRGLNAARPGGGREPGNGELVPELAELTPFSVFCALHLGITERDGFSPQGIDAVARRFGLSRDALRDYLSEHSLLEGDLRRANFDLESAQLDIRVAPQGISRTELARSLYEELCNGEAG
jgi:hypothetical protein